MEHRKVSIQGFARAEVGPPAFERVGPSKRVAFAAAPPIDHLTCGASTPPNGASSRGESVGRGLGVSTQLDPLGAQRDLTVFFWSSVPDPSSVLFLSWRC